MAKPRTPAAPGPGARDAAHATAKPGAQDRTRERILDAFSERAKQAGIRGVLMGELASELRMSASTLYKHFASKEELTLACVERWAMELAAAEAAELDAEQPRSGFDQFNHWAQAWASAVGSLSPAFIEDLKRDYPEAHARFQEETRRRQARGVQLLRPVLKPGIDERVAFDLLNAIMSRVTRPAYAERMRTTRKEAMRSAVGIWAAGALQRRGEVRAIEDAAPRAGTRAEGGAQKRATKKSDGGRRSRSRSGRATGK